MNSEQRVRFSEALQRVAGDEETLAMLATITSEDAPGLLSQIEESTAKDDLETAAKAAHSLKGMLGTFETDKPVSDLQPFIDACRARDASAAKAMQGSLSSDLNSLLGEITEVAK